MAQTLDDKINRIETLKGELHALEAAVSSEITLQPTREDLVFFFGEGCAYTKKAEPSVSCLERFLKAPITRKESWHNEGNNTLWKESGGDTNCGGVPYFYNKTTGASACGAVNCEKLKIWATTTKAVL